jgi:dTDP-4-dehydrorhamnose reductase
MKILILGAGGMIGHEMYRVLSKTFPETYACFRQSFEIYKEMGVFDATKVLDNVDVLPFVHLERKLDALKPDVILNCVGITLRKKEIENFDYCLEVNSFHPQRLRCWVQKNSKYLVHFSTDCVFDGALGAYSETSYPSAKDIYGRTKYLGEVAGENCLTLRGSMIGRELTGKTELLEWAFSQKGQQIKGYSKAIYSGVTTTVMAQLVASLLANKTCLTGVYQVSSEPISKFDLLNKINHFFKLGMSVVEDSKYSSRKDLDSSKIKKAVGFVSPSWDEMLTQLVENGT